MTKPPKQLDQITDHILNYQPKPKPKSEPAKKRKRKKKKIERESNI